jgi:DNA (cytosine-5)-methyltransferase 1
MGVGGGGMRVLNLYAGIGGNRKLWEDVDVTAVEYNPDIAAIYSHFFPDDKMIVDDAHGYLLHHYKEFDFIWSSPPCPSHSRARFWNRKIDPVYPDMSLYQEVLFLEHYFSGLWVVENVIPYYQPLIEAQKINRHLFWSNILIRPFECESSSPTYGDMDSWTQVTGFNIDGMKLGKRRDQVMRNCVLPELGKHIFDCAMRYEIKSEQMELF